MEVNSIAGSMVGLCSIDITSMMLINQSWINVGPPSVTVAHIQCNTIHDLPPPLTQYWDNVGLAS